MTKTAGFIFLLVENFSHLAFSCALEPLRIANLVSGQPLYRWALAAENGATATCSNGAVTLVDRGFEPVPSDKHLFVISGLHVHRHITPDMLSFLRRERARGTPIGAICSGAYVLAVAGFLDDIKTAIHWQFHDLFAEKFPSVRLVRNVFVSDQKFMTASGGPAAADLMLHLIAGAHGPDLATAVADQMCYNAVREGSAEQRVSLQSRHGARSAHLTRAIRIMEDNIETPLSPGDIAAKIGISTRQMERLFGKYLNTSPSRYAMEMRLHRARNLIVQTELSIAEIAMACGFNSTSHFAKVFRSHFGVTPLRQRSTLM